MDCIWIDRVLLSLRREHTDHHAVCPTLDAAQVTKETIEGLQMRRKGRLLKKWQQRLLDLANKALAPVVPPTDREARTPGW